MQRWLEDNWARCAAAVGIATTAFLVGKASNNAWSWEPQLGNWGEWAAAVFTGAAFIAAVHAIRTEQQARRQDDEQRARAQARKVAIWRLRMDGGRLKYRLVNSSDEPAFMVVIRVGHPGRLAKIHKRGVVAPHTDEEEWIEVPNHESDMPQPELDIIFNDAATVTWRRRTSGDLVRFQWEEPVESSHPTSDKGNVANPAEMRARPPSPSGQLTRSGHRSRSSLPVLTGSTSSVPGEAALRAHPEACGPPPGAGGPEGA